MKTDLLQAEHELHSIMPNYAKATDWKELHDRFRNQSTESLRQLKNSPTNQVRMFAKMVLNERGLS